MTLTLPGRPTTVLVHSPGPRVSETVHALLDQGATVTLRASTPDARMTDLAGRGLVTLAGEDAALDLTAFDLVLRDPLGADLTTDVPGAQDTDAIAAGVVPGEHGTSDPDATGPDGGRTGTVTLVGGGLGDPGLLTLAGWEALQRADVVVCDRLAPIGLLDRLPGVEVVHVGKIPRGEFTPQERINAVLVEHALAGKDVVRLKGGDSFVFGRGGEEWQACVEAGIPVTVIPGVTSSVAAPELAGIPVTHRELSRGFVVVSGHVPPGHPASGVDWPRLAGLDLTLVILMGVAAMPHICATLIEHGADPATPAAAVADAGMPSMRVARGTLADIVETSAAAGVSAPAVVVIGPVVDVLPQQDHLAAAAH